MEVKVAPPPMAVPWEVLPLTASMSPLATLYVPALIPRPEKLEPEMVPMSESAWTLRLPKPSPEPAAVPVIFPTSPAMAVTARPLIPSLALVALVEDPVILPILPARVVKALKPPIPLPVKLEPEMLSPAPAAMPVAACRVRLLMPFPLPAALPLMLPILPATALTVRTLIPFPAAAGLVEDPVILPTFPVMVVKLLVATRVPAPMPSPLSELPIILLIPVWAVIVRPPIPGPV